MKNVFTDFNKILKIPAIRLSVILLFFITLSLFISNLQIQQNFKTYAQIVPPGVLPIYGIWASELDSLKPGWTASILYGGPTAYDLYNKTPVYNGTNSISYTITSAWDELKLIAPAAIDVSAYTFLTLYVQAGSPGQAIGIDLLNAGNDPINANPIVMSAYGGAPIPGSWTVYNIPINVFNSGGNPIKGILFKDLNGGVLDTQPPIYIDEINFTVQQAQDIPPPSGTLQISAPTLIPTPSMPYYPNISPWIFIIPGILVALAIIFQ